MERCEGCGNNYARAFKVIMNDVAHTFDSFECAIQVLAPKCSSCGMKIIGHGLEDERNFYCCAGCARLAGVTELKDHVDRAH